MNTAAELALADIGAGQWGLVTTPQAVAAGLNRMQLSRLNEAGILTRLTHGVYAMRSSIGEQHLDLAAAWLSLEPARLAHERLADLPDGAVVSHASAADLHGLGDLDADRHEFTTTARKQTRRAELRLRRGVLTRADITRRDGLPVTTPVRTVVDLLAAGHDLGHVAGVVADAVRTHQIDLDELAGRVGPHAIRFGFAQGDGQALVRHLLAIGGAEEQVDAEQLASIARNHQVTIRDLVGVSDMAQQDRLVNAVAAMAAQQKQIMSVIAEFAARQDPPNLDALAKAIAQVDAAGHSDDLQQRLDQLARAVAPAARAAIEQMNTPQAPVKVRMPPVPEIPEGALNAFREAAAHLASSLPEPNPEVMSRVAAVMAEEFGRRDDPVIRLAIDPNLLGAFETAGEAVRVPRPAADEPAEPAPAASESSTSEND